MPSKDQPSTSAKKTGRATTNQMSRDPNRKNRAADSRLMAVDFDRIEVSFGFTLALPMSSFNNSPTDTRATAMSAAMVHRAAS